MHIHEAGEHAHETIPLIEQLLVASAADLVKLHEQWDQSNWKRSTQNPAKSERSADNFQGNTHGSSSDLGIYPWGCHVYIECVIILTVAYMERSWGVFCLMLVLGSSLPYWSISWRCKNQSRSRTGNCWNSSSLHFFWDARRLWRRQKEIYKMLWEARGEREHVPISHTNPPLPPASYMISS